MKLDKDIRDKLHSILGFKYEDEEYNDLDLAEIVEDLIEAVEDKNDVIEAIEMDMAENYKYVGGEEYDDY